MTLRSIQKTYNDIAAEFDITRYKPWPQTVEFINDFPENSLILDLGCGNGRNMVYIKSLSCGYKVIGLDLSVRMLRLAKNKLGTQDFNKDSEFILGDVIKLPFRDSVFDGIIFVATLHHLPSSEQRLASVLELERCLKPGGKGFIGVWDFEQERFADELKKQLKEPPTRGEFGDVLVPWTGKRGGIHQRFYHLFYKNELEELLGKTNLTIEKLFRAADNHHAVVRKQ